MYIPVDRINVGKYMVRATNAGGEAQSIADFAIFDPTPDTRVEVHKTVVYENPKDKNAIEVITYRTTIVKKITITIKIILKIA